jgi:hypothetical protein
MAKKTSQSTRKKPTQDNFEVSNIERGSAAAVGRNARALVVNFFGGGWQFFAVMLVIALAASGYFVWKWANPEKMTGGFRIAIAGFETTGDSDSSDIGSELSRSVYQKIDESLSELKTDYDINVWGPDKVGKIEGDTAMERSVSAQEIAKRIDANIIIYGFVDATNSTWQIAPEFYIASINSFQIEEITGQYQLGKPFTLKGQENAARRLELNSQFNARSQAISQVTVGLLYYSIQDYQTALETFKVAENIQGWEDAQGKQVLYLLMGNAASKSDNLDIAIEYLNKSLEIDPEYSRPMITTAGVYYLQALEPFKVSEKPEDIDQFLLNKAIETYQSALLAKNQPPLSDISTKVNFGLGQAYFMQAYGGKDLDLNLAVANFQQVISDYGDGKNPRIRELAAESHARMGLLNLFSGYTEEAAREYQLAADLLFDNEKEQKKYQAKADELKAQATETP